MAFVLTVGGVDLSPYVAYQGFKWQRNDVDSPDAGRTLDAQMDRSRVAQKVRLDVTCRPLTTAEAKIVLNAINPEFVSVTYTDPQSGTGANSTRTATMYSNNVPASYMMLDDKDVSWWNGIEFPLIEK